MKNTFFYMTMILILTLAISCANFGRCPEGVLGGNCGEGSYQYDMQGFVISNGQDNDAVSIYGTWQEYNSENNYYIFRTFEKDGNYKLSIFDVKKNLTTEEFYSTYIIQDNILTINYEEESYIKFQVEFINGRLSATPLEISLATN